MEMIVEDIVIVGAGIAGLATSLGLHRLGVASLVLESSEKLRVYGFGLTTWTNAWKALDALGIGDILRHQHLRLTKSVTTSLIMGQETSTTSLRGTAKHCGDIEVRCVLRQLMVEALANELPSGTVRYSSKLIAIEDSGFSKILHLQDGTTIKTKVLIGCDGIKSVVAKWLGLRGTSFTGRYCVRGCVNNNHGHGLQPSFMHFFGKGFRSGFLPCDHKTVYWFLTWTPNNEELEMAKSPNKMKQFVLSKLEKAPSDIRRIIEKTEAEDIFTAALKYRPQWELIRGNISKGNVCVAGDAFHPMAPDLGQGGCCSLEDAVVLARCVAQVFNRKNNDYDNNIIEEEKEKDLYKRVEAALEKYANERKWRSIDISVTSLVVGFIQQGDLDFVSHLRDKYLASFLAHLMVNKSDFDCGRLNIVTPYS
ncbi:monooxygenase 2 [Arachis duranensis]|uniref:Monooxygenase 2 n=1 Tax=Arachis duranensis TaxID=130453 RepID=A0A6P4C752_ARADU|nr:monooxygenase 2 [Arachis duranensis]